MVNISLNISPNSPRYKYHKKAPQLRSVHFLKQAKALLRRIRKEEGIRDQLKWFIGGSDPGPLTFYLHPPEEPKIIRS